MLALMIQLKSYGSTVCARVNLQPTCRLPIDSCTFTTLMLQEWPRAQDAIVVAIEMLQLWQHHSGIGTGRVFIMFSFLPGLCKAQQQQTACMPVSQEPMSFQFAMVRAQPQQLSSQLHHNIVQWPAGDAAVYCLM